MKAISAGPFQHASRTVQNIILISAISASPAFLWSVYRFGLPVLFVYFAAMAGAFLAAYFGSRYFCRGSSYVAEAVLSGFLTAFFMPWDVALYIPFFASFVGIGLGTVLWGGHGRMWLNTVALSLVFALVCWPQNFESYSAPPTGTAVQAEWHNLLQEDTVSKARPSEALDRLPESSKSKGNALVAAVLKSLAGLQVPEAVEGMIAGFDGRLAGTSGVLLILLGGMIMMSGRFSDWRMVSLAFALHSIIVYALGGLPYGDSFFRGDLVVLALNGTFLASLFFVFPLVSTLPHSRQSRFLYAALYGLISGLLTITIHNELSSIIALLVSGLLLPFIDGLGRRSLSVAVRA